MTTHILIQRRNNENYLTSQHVIDTDQTIRGLSAILRVGTCIRYRVIGTIHNGRIVERNVETNRLVLTIT